jgi:phosphopantothenoylcysteine decarboxylase/phosphopantothenate--cysteine ligase
MSKLIKPKKNILILISGSIAAYKTCYIISQLMQSGHNIQVATTREALNFVGQATLEGLSGRPVLSDTFAHGRAMEHIQLVRWANLILLCPATANIINKMAAGIADDLVSTIYLAHDFSKPFLIAPAMNTAMFKHPTTQNALAQLKFLGLQVLDTGLGSLACGEIGAGRLLEPELILKVVNQVILDTATESSDFPSESPSPKERPKILITGGGTQEPIDSMRVISNHSSGQTAAYIADVLTDLGFDVHYLGSNSAIKPLRSSALFTFTTFGSLNQQLRELVGAHSYLGIIHAAAVSDFHVTRVTAGDLEFIAPIRKLPSNQKLTVELAPNFKILPRLKGYSQTSVPKVVGFKFTDTDSLEARSDAANKLYSDGGVDLVVHNDLSDIDRSNGLHSFTLYSSKVPIKLPNRLALAEALADFFSSELPKNETVI